MMVGGCQCGAVRYEIRGEPLALFVCHCRECQRQSSSAFGISVIVRADTFAHAGGAIGVWSRPAARAGRLDCMFCPRCGSRLWHASPGQDTLSVKGGSLDTPPDLSHARHIWVSRKLAGAVIPDGCEQWPEEPD